jgi:hypothetical protein
MEIKKFIQVFDEVLPWKVLIQLIQFANKVNFTKAKVGEGTENFEVRRTYASSLTNFSDSLTEVHWANLLHFFFQQGLNEYPKKNNILDFKYDRITNIDILKYENSGFYTWHVDHFASIPRTMSCILLLNNDYKGGELCFRNPDGSEEWEVEVKPNRMIIWPSNFLYPHTVKPVTEGTRYSVVAWAL